MKASVIATPVLASGLILASFVGLCSNILRAPSSIIEEEPVAYTQQVRSQNHDVAIRGIAFVIRSGAGVLANTMTAELKRAAENKS